MHLTHQSQDGKRQMRNTCKGDAVTQRVNSERLVADGRHNARTGKERDQRKESVEEVGMLKAQKLHRERVSLQPKRRGARVWCR